MDKQLPVQGITHQLLVLELKLHQQLALIDLTDLALSFHLQQFLGVRHNQYGE